MSNAIAIFIVAYLIVVFLLAMTKPIYVSGRKIQLFRALFPSWRFFEDVCRVPMLHFRITQGRDDLGPWLPALPKLKRSPLQLLVNPQGNLFLAYNSLLEQLENDLQDADERRANDFVNTASYQLVKRLVEERLRETQPSLLQTSVRYQFKVSTRFQGRPDLPLEDILISAIHEV